MERIHQRTLTAIKAIEFGPLIKVNPELGFKKLDTVCAISREGILGCVNRSGDDLTSWVTEIITLINNEVWV